MEMKGRAPTVRSKVLCLAPLGLLAVACGTGTSQSPALAGPAPVVATPIPPTPSPTPDPSIPPPDSGCGKPYPPPIGRVAVKVYQKGREFWTMDSTPLAGPDA